MFQAIPVFGFVYVRYDDDRKHNRGNILRLQVAWRISFLSP